MIQIHILGIGMGPAQVTPEVSAALAEADYVIAAKKSADDGLLALRREVAARARPGGVPVVEVVDPERDRAQPADYPGAVASWHQARVAAYEQVLLEQQQAGRTRAAFLVWGDPSLYDSTLRIVDAIKARGVVDVTSLVLPGISAPQLLAAKHGMVLHAVGAPVHITTGRHLEAAAATGQDNIVVMLLNGSELATLQGDWQIWWGANLGATGEELVCGHLADVVEDIAAARSRAKASAGWVMDLCLLRAQR